MLCCADVPSCLGGSNLQDSAGSWGSPANPLPSLLCGLTAAACFNASQSSDRRHAVYVLPVRLLRHMQTLQQNVDADTWQKVWCLYATEDLPPGESHLDIRVAGAVLSCSVCLSTSWLGQVSLTWLSLLVSLWVYLCVVVCLPVKAQQTPWSLISWGSKAVFIQNIVEKVLALQTHAHFCTNKFMSGDTSMWHRRLTEHVV